MRLPGVLSTVGNAAGPVAIQDSEMERLRRIMEFKAIEPHAYITAGDKVRVNAGPLEGIVGVAEKSEWSSLYRDAGLDWEECRIGYRKRCA